MAACQIDPIRYKAIIIDQFADEEPALDQGVAIVVDIGKTHARVSLWSRGGRCLHRLTRANQVPPAQTWQALDTADTSAWLVEALAACAGHPVEAIIPVTHGAAVAGLRGDALAWAPIDYEWPIPTDHLIEYRAGRDPFALTGSPALPGGLNFGAQLHVLDALEALDDTVLLPYAQYWAWWLSGVAVSEVTSLGCHSDLWCPATGEFSPMAQRRGWADRFAPLARAGDAIGTLRPELARRTGLPTTVRVHAGLHDSNAALLAARTFPELAGREATVLSTGTWFIALRSPAGPVDLAGLPADRDCLVNVDALGRAVPSARFMGGREIALLDAQIDGPGLAGLAEVLINHAMVLPTQMHGTGPFPAAFGRWIDRPGAADARCAAVALYAALMAEAALDLIGARDRLLIEGRFAGGELFTRALATLRPDMQVFTAGAATDVSFGALTLVLPELTPQGALCAVAPLDRSLTAYRREWYDYLHSFA